jgi:hypothetical protein
MAQRSAGQLPNLDDFKPNSLRGTAGFFRVGQARNGQWWLVDPHGRPFFGRAVAGVNLSGRTGGRQPLAGPYASALMARHGGDAGVFARSAIVRLRSWNFNTLGAWTGPELVDQGMYFTETLELHRVGPVIHAGDALLPDVFDPAWREAVAAQVRERCTPLRNSPELIGYFTDHELRWAQPRTDRSLETSGAAAPAERPTLLQLCLSLEPSARAYHAAWEFVLAPRQGDLETLARDWAVPLPNKEMLRQLTQAETPLRSEGYLRDERRFSHEFARRYFSTCAAAIRAEDPNHLLLGCRFDIFPGSVVAAECAYPHVDIVAAQPEADAWERTAQVYHGVKGMPVWLVDLNWAAPRFRETPLKREPRGLTTIERMLKKGRTALERVCTQRSVVGYEWSRWADGEEDEPPFGRGLVHTDDREAREHTELLSDFNARAERLRAKGG